MAYIWISIIRHWITGQHKSMAAKIPLVGFHCLVIIECNNSWWPFLCRAKFNKSHQFFKIICSYRSPVITDPIRWKKDAMITRLPIKRSIISKKNLKIQIYTYKTWILFLRVYVFVHVFQSHQMSQGHEILALGLLWANLKHDEPDFWIIHFNGF